MGLSRDTALRLLGLEEGFDPVELKKARHRALAARHPDRGGSTSQVLEIELACQVLARSGKDGSPVEEIPLVRRGVDRPSFTMDLLPVEAFEVLLVAAAEIGDIADDEPPYRLEVRMHDPRDVWIVLELVPDAGGSTVSLSIDSRQPVAIDDVRDLWVETINRL